MKKNKLILFMAVPLLFAECNTAKKVTQTAAGYETVFFDDFSGNKLDTSKWNVIVTRNNVVNNELQAYVDSSSTIYFVKGNEAEGATNGALALQPRWAPGYTTKEGRKFDFISGRIDSRNKAEFLYGSFSARIKLPDGEGLWPAWWMLGKGRWPDCGEIDIMEYVGEKDWASAALHGPGYSGETPFVDRLYFSENNDVTNWHIYTVEWSPDTLVFKYDDIPMFRITRPMVEHFGKWAFDNSKFLILNFAVGGGYPVKLNGTKQPYFGLPTATAELIKQNKSRMLVDWVRVTKRKQ
jgi:beta-glucanase (GH16 family)